MDKNVRGMSTKRIEELDPHAYRDFSDPVAQELARRGALWYRHFKRYRRFMRRIDPTWGEKRWMDV